MNDQRREILNQVASGTITAEEGAARLEALESEAAATEAIPAQPPAPSTGIRQVTVNSRFGNTEIVGDPTVATAVAEGPHRARQDGDAMVIDQNNNPGGSVFYLYALASMLATQPMQTTLHRMAITQADVFSALTQIDQLSAVKNDADAQKAFAPCAGASIGRSPKP